MTRYSDLIVGTGPTAWATALGLLTAGRHPVFVDFGSEPWADSSDIAHKGAPALKGSASARSLFSYPQSLICSADREHLPLSSARGGLSEIWGAGILARTFDGMPELREITNDFTAATNGLLRHITSLGVDDQTSERFQLPNGSSKAPQSTRYAKIAQQSQSSRHPGLLFGYPRIAFSRSPSHCVRCGLCRSGCPEELFLNSRREIETLVLQKRATLINGPVTRIIETQSKIKVETPTSTLDVNRLYLCAGPIATPALLQRSGLLQDEIEVQDSAVFYGMAWNSQQIHGDESQFASAHLVAFSDHFSADDFQLAFYESHPELSNRIANLLRIPSRLVSVPRAVQSRLNPLIGFLDSRRSGKLLLQYRGGRTVVYRVPNSLTRSAVRFALSRVAPAARRLGLLTMPFVNSIPPVGSGYHSGASIPIGGESVSLSGSLIASNQIYVCDASSLPHIWAGSHTFAAMINGYRIAVASAS